MPDRAVSGDDFWLDHTSKPRALVAISEDRQWLVVLDPHPVQRGDVATTFWSVIHWNGVWWEDEGFTEDHGESAEDVLAAWLESRT